MKTTVGKFLEKAMLNHTISEEQIVAYYDSNNNLKWLGKAGYYPIYLGRVPFINAFLVGNELRINEKKQV